MEYIYPKIKQITNKEEVSFHVPGHKNGKILLKYEEEYARELYKIDTTEINGTDDLHDAKEIINQAQNRASKLYNSYKTYFLINGTTVGILASIMSQFKENDKVVVQRDCHKAVINALILSGARPIYIYPKIDSKTNLSLGIDSSVLKNLLEENKDIKGVIISSPSYYGIAQDVSKISKLTDEYKKILIVDEAHGAHNILDTNLPKTSLEQGADISIMSIHKTLPSFTQSSVLHINNKKNIDKIIDIDRLLMYLKMLQSSSPSYLLMTSLDKAFKIAEQKGKYLMSKLLKEILKLKSSLKNNNVFEFLENDDITKIYIKSKIYALDGKQMHDILEERYNIIPEFHDERGVLLVSSIGNDEKDFSKLKRALEEIIKEYDIKNKSKIEEKASKKNKKTDQIKINKNNQIKESKKLKEDELKKEKNIFNILDDNLVLTPKEAFNTKSKQIIKLKDSVNQISNEFIIPYPPGIPILVPGERITKDIIDYVISNKDTINILGLKDDTNKNIEVIEC
ncbi:aminotransferase class I/II-fold pyridoxal phosphate-dependent enzyme [Peptostreptococcaceae bacterium AGR-M142]